MADVAIYSNKKEVWSDWDVNQRSRCECNYASFFYAFYAFYASKPDKNRTKCDWI